MSCPVGLDEVGEAQRGLVVRHLQQLRRVHGVIEIRQRLLGERQHRRHGVHHVEPLDTEHVVHGGVHVVAAQAPGHEAGHLHLAGKGFVQLLLPLRHGGPGDHPAAGLPNEGLQVGDEDGDLPRDPVAARVRDGHGQSLIPQPVPVGLRIEADGQGGGVAGADYQALGREPLAGADIGDGVRKDAHRRHRVGDHQRDLIDLAGGLHLNGIDPGHGGVQSRHVRDEPAGGGILGQKGLQGRHRLPRLDGQVGYRAQNGAGGLDEAHVAGQVLEAHRHRPFPHRMELWGHLEGHAHQLGVGEVRDELVRSQLLVEAQHLLNAAGRGGRGVRLADHGNPGAVLPGHQHHRVPGLSPVDLIRVEAPAGLAPVLHEGGSGRAAAGHLPLRQGADLTIEPLIGPHRHTDKQQDAQKQEQKPVAPMGLSLLFLFHRCLHILTSLS